MKEKRVSALLGAGRRGLVSGSLLCALVAFSAPAVSTPITLDFEDLAGGDYGGVNNYAAGALVSNGFVLDPGEVDWSPDAQSWIGHYHIVDAANTSPPAHNGSNYFLFDYFFDDSSLNVYALSGVFGIRQFDLAESLSFPAALGVTFTGYLADGGTISQTVTMDGVFDGAGPLADFQTFTFDDQWSRLTNFSIVASHAYLNPALDNLVLTTVPEPSSVALLSLGLLGLAFGRRGNRGEAACS